MNEENKSERENKRMWSHLVELCRRRSKKRDEPFPPKLSRLEWGILVGAVIVLILALPYLIEQLCLIRVFPCLKDLCLEENCSYLKKIVRPCVCCTYVAFGLVLVALVAMRCALHKLFVHKARREDISEVEALFVEAKTVQRPSSGPLADEKRFERKKEELHEEVSRLKKVGNKGWTEYQVLSLNQMLVDFLEVDELKARARSTLADLEDYAVDSAYRYDQKQYDRWNDKIKEAIEETDKAGEKEKELTKKIEALQAELRTLMEHVAGYTANWSKGSAILNGIRICSVVAIPLLLGMGLLPVVHPANIENSDDKILVLINWGLLGVVGAVAAVLLNLRKSDYVEVGNTEGRKELWRTIPGLALGLVAGVLAYCMIAGGLFASGSIIPALEKFSLKNIGLSTLWAVSAGFYFERVFDRMLSTTMGGS